ncbi:prolyl oligopeptidase [Elizabethkingia anophelis]|uniref:prolyl oligopeptidase family serine peptidase n=1 Tax=Elizabethkingia anophelis TaxID=1117645 RepID=UPI0012B1FA53|nr:prolyl oligopeptidase family serine peptidase [Elizabethkingia anophelis]MCT3699883.1 prolyl oligopeptidase family serine peptidase [Elizabethkingia anophelis]MCT4123495.1 prolyl oligopeptidase family serine peptidase [Elizabethkingia anophelis]MDV3549211.1 prolyl oligopeptidase [Elizabethkingia anophelis]MDV3562786.1 prolyl oligopeptidase [Elizabethkingia anophelis]MDV3626197.1 prolyl oligopeptidase [Elizabethkingia anophelis]
MKKKYLLLFINSVSSLVIAQKTNLAPSVPVTDDYHGIKVVDEYRNLEDLKYPATINWMKSQTDYANSIVKNIPNRQYYITKRKEFDKRTSFFVSNVYVMANDVYFYLKKTPDQSAARLYYRKGFSGQEKELYNPENFLPQNNKQYQINYIKPNYDGTKVVISLTEGGKEISNMIIYDVISNRLLPHVITNCWPSDGGGISWLPDNNSFIYLHYPVTDQNSKLFLKDMISVLYTIGEDPKKLRVVLSKENNPDLKINSEDFPIVNIPTKDSRYLIGRISGAVRFKDTYYMKSSDILKKDQWKILFRKEDKISSFIIKGDKIIYVSEKDETNAIYSTSLIYPNFKTPEVIVPPIQDETIKSLNSIKDGFIFTTTKNGVEAKLYLYKNNKAESLKLPIPAGDISVTTQSNQSNDFWITCNGWKNDTERFRYNSLSKRFTSENLAPLVEFPEFKDIIVEEITVKSHDGLDIPLSLIYKKGIEKNKRNPVIIDAYGAYATISSPYFAKTYILWALQGGIVAIAHVRGGGEKGEKWHEGGYKFTKPNSWKDLISCTEYLINENYTSSDNVAIWGASAGGITMGRAMTERPDLFKAVIIDAGVTNVLRMEITPNGLNNVKEFGSSKVESEFKALLEMDAYQHVKKGIRYPSVLITGGINDPRVSPWMPAKFAAKLMANSISDNPILLKIDYDGGHGGDISLTRVYDNLADTFAFALWQLGHPDYQQVTSKNK